MARPSQGFGLLRVVGRTRRHDQHRVHRLPRQAYHGRRDMGRRHAPRLDPVRDGSSGRRGRAAPPRSAQKDLDSHRGGELAKRWLRGRVLLRLPRHGDSDGAGLREAVPPGDFRVHLQLFLAARRRGRSLRATYGLGSMVLDRQGSQVSCAELGGRPRHRGLLWHFRRSGGHPRLGRLGDRHLGREGLKRHLCGVVPPCAPHPPHVVRPSRLHVQHGALLPRRDGVLPLYLRGPLSVSPLQGWHHVAQLALPLHLHPHHSGCHGLALRPVFEALGLWVDEEGSMLPHLRRSPRRCGTLLRPHGDAQQICRPQDGRSHHLPRIGHRCPHLANQWQSRGRVLQQVAHLPAQPFPDHPRPEGLGQGGGRMLARDTASEVGLVL
mmetsp:Transcript_118716/g.340813  ORF Transcript_118716/g.340813 Transcript_118716/m.340813 type:complete len:380 (+) Transcript_118716:402-1541(+)